MAPSSLGGQLTDDTTAGGFDLTTDGRQGHMSSMLANNKMQRTSHG
jgi:hypothetical protein